MLVLVLKAGSVLEAVLGVEGDVGVGDGVGVGRGVGGVWYDVSEQGPSPVQTSFGLLVLGSE